MKNSIGSLAALAALSAPALAAPAEPGPMIAASFTSTDVSFSGGTHMDFDFNGDSIRDFYVYGNGGVSARFGSDIAGNYYVTGLTLGQEFNHLDMVGSGEYEFFNAGQSGYYGFAFDIAGATHYGWVNFVVNDVDNLNEFVTVQSGGWQSVASAFATTGVIPEPATAGALLGAGALMGAVALRRRPRA